MHVRSRQDGGTLIELMIALAIIGILAAAAIPSYASFVARAKIAEGLGLLGPVKMAVVEYHAVHGDLPQASNWLQLLKILGLPVSTATGAAAGNYVERIWWNNGNREIRIRYGVAPVESGILALQANTQGNPMTWRCYSPQNSIPDKYLPKSCRSAS